MTTNDKEVLLSLDSPEAVAYQLMIDILKVEHDAIHLKTYLSKNLSKEKILDTYKECLATVKDK